MTAITSAASPFLVELLKRDRYNLYQMAHEQTTADVLNSVVPEALSSIPVLYQAGYLTLKGYDSRFELYQLGFPNKRTLPTGLPQQGRGRRFHQLSAAQLRPN